MTPFTSRLFMGALLTIIMVANITPNAMAQKKIVQIACLDLEVLLEQVRMDQVLIELLSHRTSHFLKEVKRTLQTIEDVKSQLNDPNKQWTQEETYRLEEDLKRHEGILSKLIDSQKTSPLVGKKQLSDKVIRSLYTVVKDVSIKKGYSLVLEKRTAVIYADPEVDITQDVMAALQDYKKKALLRQD